MNVFDGIENDLDTDLFNTNMSMDEDHMLDNSGSFNMNIMDSLNTAAMKGWKSFSLSIVMHFLTFLSFPCRPQFGTQLSTQRNYFL